jgi:mannan endo-1,4-beta-mannosidase
MSWKAARLPGAIAITLLSGVLMAQVASNRNHEELVAPDAAPQTSSVDDVASHVGAVSTERHKQTKPPKRKPGKSPFVTRKGSDLYLNGKPFRFAGSNNYYPIYKSQLMVDALFDKAKTQGFDVMRVWGALDIGNEDGSNSVDGQGAKEGVYFQYWNGSEPAYNDGPNGLERLDYVVYKAGQNGIKLVIPFVNNWNAFGGMDQYVRWRAGQYHDEFYTDPLIRQWYKNWIAHVLNRVNVYTGKAYKDDPTIMTWELANEPRCLSAGVYPRSSACTTQTLIDWADEMSTYIKSIDRNHLVSAGDEGFYCIPGAEHWTENCSEGVDTVAFAQLENIDVMSLHLYPDHWGTDAAWGTEWITRHIADADRIRKPVVLGEFGWVDKNTRNTVFKDWTDAVFKAGGDGALYWILSDLQDDGTLYPDFDQFTVYCPSPVCTTFTNFATMMEKDKCLKFAPVADDDRVETAFDTVATLTPLANDIAYLKAQIASGSIDLDPTTKGRQTVATTSAGIFLVNPDDTVTFTPTPGFVGQATVPYVAKDTKRTSTNVANLRVTVRPDPGAAIVIFSFETGTEGWRSVNNLPATFAQSSDFATDGSLSLRVDVGASGDWFGTNLPEPIDLSGKTRIKVDFQLTGPGQGHAIVLQVGSGFAWCQSEFQNADGDTTGVIDIDLTAMGCRAEQNDVRAIWVFLGGNRTYHLDAVRAE